MGPTTLDDFLSYTTYATYSAEDEKESCSDSVEKSKPSKASSSLFSEGARRKHEILYRIQLTRRVAGKDGTPSVKKCQKLPGKAEGES